MGVLRVEKHDCRVAARSSILRHGLLVAFVAGLSCAPGCSPTSSTPTSQPAGGGAKAGAKSAVTIDGSSTLGPMVDLAAEWFMRENPGKEVNVRTSGTSAGFARFLAEQADQRIDVCKASRPIAQSEIAKAKALGVEFFELPVGLDGIAIVVNPKNTFCTSLTLGELRAMWEPGSKINNWSQVRAGFPDKPLKLFGAGRQSGTFDVFTERVVGKVKQSRIDYTPSESDFVLVTGIAGEEGALGYFGFAYYETSRDRLSEVAIEIAGKGIKPTRESIRTGEYPIARPLFLYVARQSAARPEVRDFVHFFLGKGKAIVEHEKVSSVALTDALYQAALRRFDEGVTGSVYTSAEMESRPLAELFLGGASSAPSDAGKP